MLKKKVYILDYEVISPIGVGREQLIGSIRDNITADQIISRVNTNGIPFNRAAEVKEELSGLYKDEDEQLLQAAAYDRKLELIMACYGKMKDRAEQLNAITEKDKTGVILGIGADVAPFELFEDEMVRYLSKDYNPIAELYTHINSKNSPVNLANNPYDVHSIYIANKFNAGAFQKNILTACVSSTQAIADGYDAITCNEAEVVIAGGTDSLINLLALISFGKLGVIPESDDNVGCLPFDLHRKGTLAGESAGLVVLASEDFVNKHKLSPVAEFMGYGNTLDAYKITAPDPAGQSMSKAIHDAVNNAGISVDMIDYINAHGTGTRHNDQLELKALEMALGKHVKNIPISSTKDRHGHAIAAAGIQELCLLLELMKHDTIPQNLHLQTPCDDLFNLVRENYTARINYAITSNFAFGGINTVLTIKNEMT